MAELLTATDLDKARAWGLSASYLEEKTGHSALLAVGLKLLELRGAEPSTVVPVIETLRWALETGAAVSLLEQRHPGFLFDITRVPGASVIWDLLLRSGYSKSTVTASFKDGTARTTTKLGLLCSPPYCYCFELSSLIRILISHGADPNERDSEGHAPLGRLNDQIKLADEQKAGALDAYKAEMLRSAEALLALGGEPSSILPLAHAHAAPSLRSRILAAVERKTISEEIHVPSSMDGMFPDRIACPSTL